MEKVLKDRICDLDGVAKPLTNRELHSVKENVELELKEWSESMNSADTRVVNNTKSMLASVGSLPIKDTVTKTTSAVKARKSFAEWQAFDHDVDAIHTLEANPTPSRITQAAQVSDDILSAPVAHRVWLSNAERTKGNEAFVSGDYEEAKQAYLKARQLDQTNHLILLNLALVSLKLEDADGAETFANEALHLQKSIKGYLRRGMARFRLMRFAGCIQDCEEVLKMEEGNIEALELKRKAMRDNRQTRGVRLPVEQFEPPSSDFDDMTPHKITITELDSDDEDED